MESFGVRTDALDISSGEVPTNVTALFWAVVEVVEHPTSHKDANKIKGTKNFFITKFLYFISVDCFL